MYHFGQMLKRIATQKGIPIEEIAQKSGKSTVSVYRDFKNVDLNTKVIKKYCEVLNVSLPSLFMEEERLIQELSKKQKEIEELKSELETIRKWSQDKDLIIKLFQEKEAKRNSNAS